MIQRYALVKRDKIEMFGPLPYFWKQRPELPNVDMLSLSLEQLKGLGWLPLVEQGRRPYDSELETENVAEPVLVDGVPVQTITYTRREDYQLILYQRQDKTAHLAITMGKDAVQAYQRALQAQAVAASGNDKLVIATGQKLLEAHKALLDSSLLPVQYEGNSFQADKSTKDNLMYAISAYTALDIPEGYYWLDVDNTPVPANLAFLRGLLKVITDRDFTLLQTFWAAKKAAKDEFISKVI